MTFRASQDADFEQVEKRRKKLEILELAGYVYLIAYFVFMIVSAV